MAILTYKQYKEIRQTLTTTHKWWNLVDFSEMRAQFHSRVFKTHRMTEDTSDWRDGPGDTAGAGVRTPPTPDLSDNPRSR